MRRNALATSVAPKMPPVTTLSDVARRAKVSVSVVSRVLNDDPALRVRPETRDRVRRVAAELHYTPNYAGRALRMSRSGAIGLIVPDMNNAVFDEVTRGVEDSAGELNMMVLVGRAEKLQPGSDFLRRLAGEGRVDGFVIQRRDEIDGRVFEEIIERNIPVVLINSVSPRHSSVVLDDVVAARLATQHLIDLGHTDIALIGGDRHSYTGPRRERGFVDVMADAGLSVRRNRLLHVGYFPEDGRRGLTTLFSRKAPGPTAVVVGNINAALGAVRAAGELGIAVPRELSVVAIHDTWVANYVWPQLTTVRMPQYELGREGMRLLAASLTGDKITHVTISDPAPQLIVRGSTAAPSR